MKEKINELREELISKFQEIDNLEKLNELKVEYYGKKGKATEIAGSMKNLTNDEKKEVGILLNNLKNLFNSSYDEMKVKFEEELVNKKLEKDAVDITLPGAKIRRGSKHPVNRVIEEIEDLFVSMGYDVVDGPEVESDLFNFQLLNIPEGHPARDSQDTFYITDDMLLRTQTSPMQARTMQAVGGKKPIRMICPGKVYRRDDDATHSHQFGQVEGLVIDKDISLADLKGTLEVFMRRMFGEDTVLRFRASYFPFTEPSYEVDISCFKCGGKGCSLCKHTGWIEILGSGMVHPNVLRANGYDPEVYTGFAFGAGLERIAMFRYGIPDIRYLYTNDIRFLEEFDRKDDENETK
jgi:phenylalanyl-tRNA synthetase alpha chain